MVPIVSLLFILCISLVVTRVATVALTLTGMQRDVARFQARSAFSGAGFTTSESERIVNHPVRRKIIMQLMLWGNIGIVSVISSVIFSAVHYNQWYWSHWVVLVVGILGFYAIATSKAVEKLMTRCIRFLLRRYTGLQTCDYTRLLHLNDEYGVQMIALPSGDPLIGTALASSCTEDSHVIILGIQRESGDFVGVPDGQYIIHAGDQLVLYGHVDQINQFRDTACKLKAVGAK